MTSCLLFLSDVDGLITQALLIGDYEAAVNLCLHDNRMADAIILAIAGGPELLAETQKKYFSKTQCKISKVRSCSITLDMCCHYCVFCYRSYYKWEIGPSLIHVFFYLDPTKNQTCFLFIFLFFYSFNEMFNADFQNTLYCQKYWHLLLLKDLTTLVISMSTNLNV